MKCALIINLQLLTELNSVVILKNGQGEICVTYSTSA